MSSSYPTTTSYNQSAVEISLEYFDKGLPVNPDTSSFNYADLQEFEDFLIYDKKNKSYVPNLIRTTYHQDMMLVESFDVQEENPKLVCAVLYETKTFEGEDFKESKSRQPTIYDYQDLNKLVKIDFNENNSLIKDYRAFSKMSNDIVDTHLETMLEITRALPVVSTEAAELHVETRTDRIILNKWPLEI